jgi:hypothetical protein
MNQLEYSILSAYKEYPEREFSTYELIKIIYAKESEKIEADIKNEFHNKDISLQAKRLKAKFHRKVLYHLNKLVEDGILKMSTEGPKGHKHFILNIKPGEELLVEKRKKKIILTKSDMPAMPIEGYEQRGILYKYESDTWIDRLNAVLLECIQFSDYNSLLKTISDCFSNINDVICLNDFESLVQKNTLDEFSAFLKKLSTECDDFGKKVNLVFDLTFFEEDKLDKLLSAFSIFSQLQPENIVIILDARAREFNHFSEFFEKAINKLLEKKISFYIKNRDLHDSPYLVGKGGPYTFDDKEWSYYKKEISAKVKGIACTQASVIFDVLKFFEEIKDVGEFRALLLKVAKTLLYANSMQRRKSEEYFRNILRLSGQFSKEFFMFSRNCVRFWNYETKENIKDILNSAKTEINNFCTAEESIFIACGMPTRFKIAFSTAFNEFNSKLSERRFEAMHLAKIEELYSKETKNRLKELESMFSIFDGGNEIRIYRAGNATGESVVKEIITILNTYKLPLFCYNFSELKGADIKLTRFI